MNCYVRTATVDELPAIVAMGARFYATTAYGALAPYCPASAQTLGRMLIEQGVLLVAEAPQGLVGMVGLALAPFMFNHAKRSAHEVMWWVDPDARDTGAGIALLRAIEPACRAAGAVAIQMGVLSTSPAHAGSLYRRMGYEQTETSYFKRLDA